MFSLFRRNTAETRSLANPESWMMDLFGAVPAQSGITVSPTTAMRSSAVRAAVEAIAEAVGGLPFHVYQRGADGARDRATGHPAYALLHDQANDWTDAHSFREQITRDALLHGNGYAFVNRDRDELPRELIRLQPEAVTVELDTITSEPRYRLNLDSGQRYIDRREVLHLAAASLDGVKGASPIEQCREAIALNLALERHVANFLGKGGRPSGILKFPKPKAAEEAKKIKAAWLAAHGGSASGGTALIDDGGEYQPLTSSFADSQLLQLWQHSILEIARVFRVPPHMLFELGRATWGNAAEMGATFLRFTLDRWLKAWEGEVRLKLIASADRSQFYPEFLTDDLLRTDLAARSEAYAKLIAARVLNPNEARARENLPPYAGGEQFLNPNVTMTTSTTGPAK